MLWSLFAATILEGALAAPVQPRELVHRVAARFPEPGVSCVVLADVAADGSVSVRRVSKCKPHAAIATQAVSQWRYAPAAAPSVEEIELASATRPGTHTWTKPVWRSAEEQADGVNCWAEVTIAPDGTRSSTEVRGCGDAASETWLATLADWAFDPAPEARAQVLVVPTTRQVTYRANPGFPDEVRDPNVHLQCGALLSVSADGEATVLTVRGCPEPFLSTVTEAFRRWRWQDGPGSFTTYVTVSFHRPLEAAR